MPPLSGQQGAGKKGGGGGIRAQPRSRNTTPSAVPPTASLPAIETVETEHLDLRFELFRNLTYEDLVDPSAANAVIPDPKTLDAIISRLQRLGQIIEKRGNSCDRGMRLMAQNRRSMLDELAEKTREEERRQDDEDREAREARKANKKKRKAGGDKPASQSSNIERSSPVREGSSKRKLSRDNDSASSPLSPVTPILDLDENSKVEDDAGKSSNNDNKDSNNKNSNNNNNNNNNNKEDEDEDDSDDDDDSDDGRPPPPLRPQANTFGDDPSTFPDPTVYEIRPVKPGMSEEEIKEIYSVASYPKSDLANLIAGDPPDKDFSSAKPTSQINFSTFSSYIEPYFRPFTEEDLAFLRERGDRLTPFVMPKRGKKHYSEIWAEEDGAMPIDSLPPGGRDRLPPNQARGTIEHMDDDVAETDKLSVGPLLSRLLQAMRPEHRVQAQSDDKPMANGVNADADGFDFSFGDSPALGQSSQPQTNGNPVNGINGANGAATNGNAVNASINGEQALPPATYMPESGTEAWKKASHPKLDYAQVDERIKQELRHIGFLPTLPSDPANPGAAPAADLAQADYDGHFDDEVAARLRLLQARLREQVLINGARKARLTELVKERMAYQEYQTILEDLDSQVQAAYLKRTRTMGKKPKKSRPAGGAGAGGAAGAGGGGAGGAAGMARPGIGDLTRTLMERRRRWIDSIGTVFDDESLGKVPRSADPDSSIFKPADIADLLQREKDVWDEEVEEE